MYNSLTILFLAGGISTSAAIQLVSDRSNFCLATGNGTSFNVTSLPWPFAFTDSRGYEYQLASPCNASTTCPGYEGDSVVLCQRDSTVFNEYYNCGTAEQVVWTQIYGFGYSGSWSILVFGGVQWRMTNITFVVNPNVAVPTATFVNEAPYLQYNVLITGSCLGQRFSPGC